MSEINIKQITTESRNQNTMDIDKVSTMEILQKINAEDKKFPLQSKELYLKSNY